MKSKRKEKNSFSVYATGLLALAGLMAAAFFAPQIVFRMQDGILCQNTELGVRESIGVDALNTTYEKSLGKRIRNFAEGLAGGESYYVAAQELEVDDEIYEYVHSEAVLYGEILQALMEGGLLPFDFWISNVMVRQWKQYVIYSDNYTKGVNFILWYIEAEASGGAVLKLLADAEDGTLYAVKLEESEHIWMTDNTGSGYLRGYVDDYHVAPELWYFFARSFGSMGMEELETVIQALASNRKYEIDVYIDMDDVDAEDVDSEDVDAEDAEKEYASRVMAETTVGNLTIGYYSEGDQRMRFRLPYGEATLDVIVDAEEADTEGNYIDRDLEGKILKGEEIQRFHMPYSNIVIGIQEIYEMIPEFA